MSTRRRRFWMMAAFAWTVMGSAAVWGQSMAEFSAGQLRSQADQALRAGQTARAESLYRKVLIHDPAQSQAAKALGKILTKAKRYADAVLVYEKAVAANPGYLKAHYRLGYCYRKLSRFRDSVTAYERFVQAQPSDPDPYYGLAKAYLGLKDKAQALQNYRRYVDKETRPSEARWVAKARSEILRLGGSLPQGGAQLAASGASSAPKNTSRVDARRSISQGDRAFEQGRHRAALAAYRAAVAAAPDHVEARYRLGVTQAVVGELAQAVASFEGVLRSRPSHQAARANLERVRSTLAEKLGHDPSDPQGDAKALLEQARKYLANRNYALARRVLHQAAASGANGSLCRRMLGQAALAEGDYAAAESAFQAALGVGPDAVRAQRGLGNVYARRGELERAAYHLSLFLDLARDEPAIGALEEVEAEQHLERLLALAPAPKDLAPDDPSAPAVPETSLDPADEGEK